MQNHCTIELPAWVQARLSAWHQPLRSDEEGMRLAIALAEENVRQGTGGPFGAVVADLQAGELVAAGVNLVTSAGLSAAHAEIVAISLAQRQVDDWNLSRDRSLTLFTTCEPCAMCYGAIPWAGIRALVVGASKEEAEAAGFDEGDKPADWRSLFEQRGIEVRTGVLHEQATAIFELYRHAGGEIYNAGEEPS